MGAVGGIEYKELSIDLEPGDALFMYTDGVTEAMNLEEQFYSDQRLINEITKRASEPSEYTVKGIKSDIKSFVGKASQYDDIAMLMIKYTGNR